MKCPFCGHQDTQVKDSRPSDDGSAIRRRRSCPNCNGRFTTFERVQLRELVILKRNGRRTPFGDPSPAPGGGVLPTRSVRRALELVRDACLRGHKREQSEL